MFLKKGVAEGLLLESHTTREELATEFGYSLKEVNAVLDGDMEAGVELTELLIAAFGLDIIDALIDRERTDFED